jgi:membrane fusion protein (multidrug efflux system)
MGTWFAPRRPFNKNKRGAGDRASMQSRLTALFGTVFTAGLLAACQPAPQVPPRPTPQVIVRTLQARPLPLRTELPGRTSAYQVAEVRPQVGGIVRERLFQEGAAVRAGQVLYQIDPAPYQAALEQAEASLASARAAARISELQLQRYRQLLPLKSISQQDFDNSEANYGQAQATIRQREAAANAARIDLARTRITAPISGRTGRSVITPGALVSANQANALTTISQLDPIYVDLTQSSADLLRLRQSLKSGRLQQGGAGAQKVSLVLEDGTTYPLEGRMQLAEVTVDATTGSVLLRAQFPNPEALLLPGMYVRALVTEGIDAKGMLVPQPAIVRDRKGGATVRVVTADGTLDSRPVTLAGSVNGEWLVTEGLNDGDRVVIEGATGAPPGAHVEIVAAGDKAARQTAP